MNNKEYTKENFLKEKQEMANKKLQMAEENSKKANEPKVVESPGFKSPPKLVKRIASDSTDATERGSMQEKMIIEEI